MVLYEFSEHKEYLIYLLGQGPILRYEDLIGSQSGREFLMRNLVEKLSDPIETPRFELLVHLFYSLLDATFRSNGRLVFGLPESLGGPLVNTRSGAPCCNLKEVSFKYKDGVYTKDLINSVLEMSGASKFSKEEDVNHSSEDVKIAVDIVADIINGDQRPFEEMLSLAAATKDLVNEKIYAKAIELVAFRRKDVDLNNSIEEASNESGVEDITAVSEIVDMKITENQAANLVNREEILKEKLLILAEKGKILIEKEKLLDERERLLEERESILAKKEQL